MALPVSLPSMALGGIAVFTIIKHSLNIRDPSMLMKGFHISTAATAQTVAFLLVLINGYDLLGALQDNRLVVWFSIAARLLGAAFFGSCGSPWNKLIAIELKTTAILVAALAAEQALLFLN